MTAEETVGERLRRARTGVGLAQKDCVGPGVSAAYVSKVERGERTMSVKALRVIAPLLGVTAEYLETGSEGLPASKDVMDVIATKDRLIRDLRRRLGVAYRGTRYLSVEEFLADDESRRETTHIEVGDHWVEGRTTYPTYLVSWIEATGEVVAWRRGNPSRVEIVGWAATQQDVEDAMEGWQGQGKLAWVRARFVVPPFSLMPEVTPDDAEASS